MSESDDYQSTGTTRPNRSRTTRRGRVALVLSGAVGGALIHPTAQAVGNLINTADGHIHQASESSRYSQPDLYDTMRREGGFGSDKEVLYPASPDVSPQEVAAAVDASDTVLVANEVAGQEAGNPDFVVIPKDQLNNPSGR